MRWPIVFLMLPLLGCAGNDNRSGVAGQNFTQDSGQCSKHAWGSPEMAQCLDAVRATRTGQPVAAPAVASAPPPAAPPLAAQPAEAAPATRSWQPWTWFSSGASE